jgi:hypothetical protein
VDVDVMQDIALLEELLQRDWLSPQGAVLLAGISYAWLRLLGERGTIATLQTPLGRLDKRADVEQVRAERQRSKKRQRARATSGAKGAERHDR